MRYKRHTTASLLMMSGSNSAAVQKILRHSDPKITTQVYGHLSPGYLRAEVDRLSFNLPEVAPAEAPIRAAAGADSNPFAAPLLHNSEPRNGTAGNPSRNASDSRPFTERAILDSNQWPSAPESESAGVQGFTMVPNPSESFAAGRGGGVQRSQPFAGLPQPFAAPLLHGAPAAAGPVRPLARAIRVLDGGKGNLLAVRAVAARLGVSTATVYGLCARGELRHVRISNVIRIEPAEVEAFIAKRRG